MSTMSWFWFASVTGALLFAAAGFFGAPVKGRGRNRDLDDGLAREREALQALALAEQRAEAARVAAAEALDELARVVEHDARSRATLDDQATMVSRLQHEVLTLRHESESAKRVHQDLTKCERELVTARGRVVESTSRAAIERAETSKRIAELEGSLARVTSERESLTAKERRTSDLLADARAEVRQLAGPLEEARGVADDLRAEADSLRREAALVLERTVAQQKTIEAVRDENASLRMGSAELVELKKRCAALTDENARLRASAFVVDSEGKARRSSPTIPEYTDRGPEGSLDNASLQRFVDDVVKTPSVSAAALTDDLGFLVVGVGDHTEALAAFGAYLTEAGARACGVLPMHAVQKVSIQDDSGITLTARTIASAPNELVLVTLGVDDKNHGQHERHETERSS
jgi:hypothetical protein